MLISKLGEIDFLEGQCNPSTVIDGRGGIFTWWPENDDKVVEFNLVYYKPNKIRGNHYHPEFNEYILIVEGSGIVMTPDPAGGPSLVRHMSIGDCMRIPANVSHAFQAISDLKLVSMLTKKWADCKDPIIHEDLIQQDEDYLRYAQQLGFTHSVEELKKGSGKD